jgi:hypothetical protein
MDALVREILPPASGGKPSATSEPSSGTNALDILRGALSILLTFGLNEEIDRICQERLGVRNSGSNTGLLGSAESR